MEIHLSSSTCISLTKVILFLHSINELEDIFSSHFFKTNFFCGCLIYNSLKKEQKKKNRKKNVGFFIHRYLICHFCIHNCCFDTNGLSETVSPTTVQNMCRSREDCPNGGSFATTIFNIKYSTIHFITSCVCVYCTKGGSFCWLVSGRRIGH